jgi:heptosyltransferase-1
MGDVIHSLPALTDAQKAIPNLTIDWVVEEAFAEIPSWHSAVNKVIPIALRRWKKQPFSTETRAQWKAFKTQLQATQYDVVIDAQGLLKSALITRLGKGKRHGYDKNSIKEPIASHFYQQKHTVKKDWHAVERIRALFALALNYTKPETQGDYAIAEHFLQNSSPKSTPYWIFLHATTRENKHWSEENWGALLDKISPMPIYLPWGAPHEKERADRLAITRQHVHVLPKSPLSEIAHLLAHAKGVISVDTGLSHLAAALDKPNFTIFGPTDPGLIGGYGKGQHALEAKTFGSNDINAITPEYVYQSLQTEHFV